MADIKKITHVDSSSSFPFPLVIWVCKGNDFKAHLSSPIETLRERVTLKTFIDTDSALKAMSAAVSSCRNEREGARRQRIACVITNMQRSHPLSGLSLLKKMKNVFHSNVFSNEFSSFPPTIVYSASTVRNPSLIDECKAAGAMLVLSNNVNELRRIVFESVYPLISFDFLFDPVLKQRAILSNIPCEYHALFYSHCLNPLPDKYGGKLPATQAQQLVLLEWRLLYDVLLSNTLEAFASHCVLNKHYIGGGLAINHLLKLRGFSPLLTCDCDFRFESKVNTQVYANHMKSVLEKHTQTVRVNMAHLDLKCGDPEVATDNNGCRVYFPLRSYNLSPLAAGTSYYDFMWKVFDVSHNWKGDPIDQIKENELCYIGEKEILKELGTDYGNHKKERRQLRLKFINFVLKTK